MECNRRFQLTKESDKIPVHCDEDGQICNGSGEKGRYFLIGPAKVLAEEHEQ